MTTELAATFDRDAERIVTPFTEEGIVSLRVAAEVIWGYPLLRNIRLSQSNAWSEPL
jgi:hypothetical protein